MLSQLIAFLTPPAFADEDEMRNANLLNVALLTIISAPVLFIIFLAINSLLTGAAFDTMVVLATLPIIVLLIGLWILMRRGHVQLASILLSVVMLLGVTAILYAFDGIRDNVAAAYVLVIMLTSLLLRGRNYIFAFTLAIVVASWAVYYAETQGVVLYSAQRVELTFWVVLAVIFVLTGLLMYYAMSNLNTALERARSSERRAREANEQLQELNLDLERRVAERTRALEISAEVSRRLSTILYREQLVKEVVDQVRDAYDYYHAHVYLWSKDRRKLVMAGGTGEAGRKLLERGHNIERGRGLVGRAAGENNVVLAPDVSQELGWLPNDLLPDTKAEVAVPIAIGDEVLGVLDVQHNVVNGLTPQDADLLQSVANQVAIALHNAHLYQETQKQAAREALINAIGQQIQNTTNVEAALKVAVRELGQVAGAQRASVRIASSLSPGDNGRNVVQENNNA